MDVIKMAVAGLTTHFVVLLVVVSAGVGVRANPAENPMDTALPQAELSINSATDALKPPNTANPQATLHSFIESMNSAYRILMAAHRENLETPGLFTSAEVLKMTHQAEEFFERGYDCLNLSGVRPVLRKAVGYESAIMLKEVFDRIELPSFEMENYLSSEKGQDGGASISRWVIPNTEIVIELVEEGELHDKFLFSPETVSQVREFYEEVKDYPYKDSEKISPNFYTFYTSTPGLLMPPKWTRWLPEWSNTLYHGQTLWQWSALIILPLGLLLFVWRLVRWWYHKEGEGFSGKKTVGWLLMLLIIILLVSLLDYILDEHINITGTVLVILKSTLQPIFILVLSTLIFWEFLKHRVQEKIDENEEEQHVVEGEGGRGGSRIDTLLLLLKKTILIVLFTIALILLLSSMGINIGPLLAGAGVVGLAIGFGAQTLVKDIISGIFFLIDDAFRVGDYIESAGIRGTVEHISLRSLRLRHHRGMVHTIPFGDMGSVTNFSRDYIITKLDVRVRYDADIHKIKKIIKKINLEVRENEELSQGLLDDIKSQGVREMDDSAMIIRVKFMTIPGEQFVLRREIYKMIQEEFRANDIDFAHRNVTVYLPPEEKENPLENKIIEAGATAAVATDQAESKNVSPK